MGAKAYEDFGNITAWRCHVGSAALAVALRRCQRWRRIRSGSDTLGAQTPTGAIVTDAPDTLKSRRKGEVADQSILVTGSRIKQDPNNSALPLQIMTTDKICSATASPAPSRCSRS